MPISLCRMVFCLWCKANGFIIHIYMYWLKWIRETPNSHAFYYYYHCSCDCIECLNAIQAAGLYQLEHEWYGLSCYIDVVRFIRLRIWMCMRVNCFSTEYTCASIVVWLPVIHRQSFQNDCVYYWKATHIIWTSIFEKRK